MAKYTINRGGKDYTFDSQEKYEEFYNLAKETAKRHGTSTADVFKTQYDLYANNPDTNPSSVGISAPTATLTGVAKTPSASVTTPTYQSKINDTINKILNREEFTFDLNGDALYNQYKDSATRQGKLAMEDAIGMASAMTGGYGNSYAQSVGQQAFNQQLEGLNDVIPEVYQLARDKYDNDTQKLLNDYAILSAEEEKDYNRKLAEEQLANSNTESGLSDDYKWTMDYALNALKNGYTVDFNTGAFTPVEEDKEYTGLFAQKSLAEDAQYIIDVLDGKKSYKSINYDALPTVGSRRAYFLLDWYKQGVISPEDMDYLAERYSISEEDMDKAIGLYNEKNA